MLPGVTAADEIEITPQMTKAGADVLSENYFSLVDGDGYPEIARIVFEAMVVNFFTSSVCPFLTRMRAVKARILADGEKICEVMQAPAHLSTLASFHIASLI
jgi:hypothetical protein